MCRLTVLFALFAGTLLECTDQQLSTIAPRGEPLRPVLEVLGQARLSGSLEFSGECTAGRNPIFPTLRGFDNAGDITPRLREMFADYPKIRVTQQSRGPIRIVEDNVPRDILNVKIDRIYFGDDLHAIYNPNQALAIVLQSPEVIAFMKENSIEWPRSSGVPGNLIGKWPAEKPHISGVLRNVTVAEALDHLLRIFSGMWVYEYCPSQGNGRHVFLGFFHIERVGSRISVVE